MPDLSSCNSVPELMEVGLQFLTEDLKAERALVLYEGLGCASGIDPQTIWTFGEVSQELLGNVLREGEPIVLMDAMKDPKYGDRNSVIISHLRSILCVPLRSPQKNKIFGLLYADNRVRIGAFNKDHLAKARMFGTELQARLASLEARGTGQSAGASELDIERLLEIEWL